MGQSPVSDFLNTADIILGLITFACVPAYPMLQLWTTRTLPRGWAFAAMLPPASGTMLLGSSLAGIADHAGIDVTSLVFFAPLAVIYLLAISGIHALSEHRKTA